MLSGFPRLWRSTKTWPMIRLLNNRENWVGRNLAAGMNERLRKASLGRTNTGVRSEWQRVIQQGVPRKDSWKPGGVLEEKKGRGHVMRSEVSRGHIIKSFVSQEISSKATGCYIK